MNYYISLGANLGAREQTIREALRLIEERVGHVSRCSQFYYSEPWGYESEHEFCNLCCLVDSDRAPMEVLHLTRQIERDMGRTHKSTTTPHGSPVYSDRSIDIDLIRVFENGKELFLQTPELTIPHPLWREREFVTQPLSQVMDQTCPCK